MLCYVRAHFMYVLISFPPLFSSTGGCIAIQWEPIWSLETKTYFLLSWCPVSFCLAEMSNRLKLRRKAYSFEKHYGCIPLTSLSLHFLASFYQLQQWTANFVVDFGLDFGRFLRKSLLKKKFIKKSDFDGGFFFAKIRKSAAAVDFENPEIRNPPRRWILRIRKSGAEKRRIFRN